MSAYNFPNSPSNGDTVNVAGIIYTYDSTDNAWKTGAGQSPAILSNGTTPSLASGITAAEIRTLIDASADPVDLSSVAQNIIPDADSTRDLGTSSKKFRDLYLSGSSLHLGSITIESDATSIVLPQLKIGTGANQVTLSGSNGTLQAGGAGITFASLSGKPTTISGYGITDAFDGAFSSLTGKPTTIAGYGITDALTLGTTATTALAGNTTFSFASLTGKPTTIAGYGITDALTLGTSATTALAGNTTFSFASLTGKPTTISGYGITDAFDGAYSSLTGIPTTIAHKNADIDIGSNDFITTGKVYFANMFSQTSNLPSATTYHGMFAHVHATGAAYFAHGGNWIELANKSYVDTQVTALVDSAPATLNTLNELAAALNDDANFATTVTTSLGLKAPLASPALTGTPTAPTAASGTNTTQLATTAFVQAAVTGGGSYNNASVDSHLNTGTASANEVLSWNGSDYDWVAQSGGGGGGASVTTSDAAPSSPSAGDLWYNTNAGGLFVYYQDANSSQWVEVVGKTGATGPTNVSIGDAAPSSPSTGQFWWNSSTNKLYIYYTDANSSQWVQATTPGAASTVAGPTGPTGPTGPAGTAAITRYANVAAFPASPTTADLAYANDTNTVYIYDGSSWDRISSGSDESPRVTTEPATSHTLNSDGSTSTLTMVAEDPEGFDIEYAIKYNTSGGALPSQLSSATTINQSTGVFTFTPTTTTSNAGTFNARLTASDGSRVTVRTIPFTLAFYPNLSDVVGRYEFFNTASYNRSNSTTALTDLSINSRNITIGNPGAYSSDGLLTFTAASTTMNFTGNQDSKTWMILFRPPSGWDRSLFWGDGGANATYYGAFRSTTADGTAYSGWSTAWSGETVTNYVNGANIGTSRVTAYNALDHGKVNSVITTGLQFPSTYLVYAQHSGYIVTHEVYAIVFWDAVLTATEAEAAHNHYRNLIGSSNMAAWSP